MAAPRHVAVFGAGITGLAAARELLRRGHAVDVYEASSLVGGLAASFRDAEGFVYDNGPRFIFSTLAAKLGILDECVPVSYYEHMHVGGKTYRFPFGLAKNARFSLSAGMAALTRYAAPRPDSLASFLRTYYGGHFSARVLMPLIEKWSGTDCREMSIDFASRLLPTNLAYVAYSLLKRLRGGITEDYYKKGRYIVYPKGSNARIFEVLTATAGLKLHFDAPLESVRVEGGRVAGATVGGREIRADAYVSTIPLPALARRTQPRGLMREWEDFSYRSIVVLFVKIDRPRVLDGLWTWFPDPAYPFYRIAEYKNALATMAPPDRTLLSLEFACQEGDAVWNRTKEELYDWIAPQLRALYGLARADIRGLDVHRSAHAYPVMKKATEARQRAVTHRTPVENLFIAGRTGMFQYKMTEGSYDSAVECVDGMQALFEGRAFGATATVLKDAYGRPLVVHE